MLRLESMIIMGDLNGRVGTDVIPEIKNRLNEEIINQRGERLVEFCAHYKIRKQQIIWKKTSTQNQNSWKQKKTATTNYIITNISIKLEQIQEVRALPSATVGIDHNLVLGKITVTRSSINNKKLSTLTTKFNIGINKHRKHIAPSLKTSYSKNWKRLNSPAKYRRPCLKDLVY